MDAGNLVISMGVLSLCNKQGAYGLKFCFLAGKFPLTEGGSCCG